LPHIAHFIPYTGTAMGGPVNGMAAYVGLLAETGYAVTVYSVSKSVEGESVRLDSRARLVRELGQRWGSFRRCPALWRQAQAAEMDLVHSHGLWTDVSRLAGDIARRRRLPHVLAPCGMLGPGALRHHGWRKVPVRFWFQDRVLREAQCLHAKSQKECDDIRRFGLHNPVAVIANPTAPPPAGSSVVRGPWSVVPGHRMVLFLGRLHPVKGLPRLLQAWAKIHGEKAERRKQKSAQKTESEGRSPEDWVLVLAGPDEGGYRRELESFVGQLGCRNNVMFTGQLDEHQKWGALAAADLFIMPSDFENFGSAIVEALSSGVPVITTTGTPWEELPAAGAGWWVQPTVEDLARALCEALAMPDGQRRAMGHRAVPIAERFRPERIAADLIHLYEWLLGRGERPECVVL
jgi:glycosyltransferase involved in cell wall biosynthesis